MTSHFVKESKNGVIVCPTLLATICRYCKQSGHTVKYCTSIKSKPSNASLAVASLVAEQKKVHLEVKTRVNRYGTLSDDSDDDEEIINQQIPQPPVLKRQSAITIPRRWVDYDSDSDIEQEI